MITLDDLLQQREKILTIAQRHGAFNVRIFGSVARGEARDRSDVDFLVDYNRSRRSSWFPMGLIEDLEALLGVRVDVVTEKSLKSRLRDRVLQEAKPL
ncbi:MAG: DNA polymerase subunit beta [Cyanobacteria bacterium]|nr:DNA polymerase subunit beta [Cyanobacteria bacterium GSL.Bin21]